MVHKAEIVQRFEIALITGQPIPSRCLHIVSLIIVHSCQIVLGDSVPILRNLCVRRNAILRNLDVRGNCSASKQRECNAIRQRTRPMLHSSSLSTSPELDAVEPPSSICIRSSRRRCAVGFSSTSPEASVRTRYENRWKAVRPLCVSWVLPTREIVKAQFWSRAGQTLPSSTKVHYGQRFVPLVLTRTLYYRSVSFNSEELTSPFFRAIWSRLHQRAVLRTLHRGLPRCKCVTIERRDPMPVALRSAWGQV